MKFYRRKIEVKFEEARWKRKATVAPWLFSDDHCDSCGKNFDTLDYAKNSIVVAEDEERRYYFCYACFFNDELEYYER